MLRAVSFGCCVVFIKWLAKAKRPPRELCVVWRTTGRITKVKFNTHSRANKYNTKLYVDGHVPLSQMCILLLLSIHPFVHPSIHPTVH